MWRGSNSTPGAQAWEALLVLPIWLHGCDLEAVVELDLLFQSSLFRTSDQVRVAPLENEIEPKSFEFQNEKPNEK